jgi:hypothetical protein
METSIVNFVGIDISKEKFNPEYALGKIINFIGNNF